MKIFSRLNIVLSPLTFLPAEPRKAHPSPHIHPQTINLFISLGKKKKVIDFFLLNEPLPLTLLRSPISCWESQGNAVSFPALLKSMLTERRGVCVWRETDRYKERQENKSEV